jgi:hypothetical protein
VGPYIAHYLKSERDIGEVVLCPADTRKRIGSVYRSQGPEREIVLAAIGGNRQNLNPEFPAHLEELTGIRNVCDFFVPLAFGERSQDRWSITRARQIQ